MKAAVQSISWERTVQSDQKQHRGNLLWQEVTHLRMQIETVHTDDVTDHFPRVESASCELT